MSKNRLLKILLPSIALTFGSQAFAYTLSEAVGHTLATSPDLLIETNTRDMVDKELRQSYAGYLPTVDLAAGWGEQYTNNATTRAANALLGGTSLSKKGTRTETRTEFSLIASQMLFDGLAVYHDVEGQKARVRAESWRVNGTAQDIALGAVEAYINVLRRRELVKENRDNLANHEAIYGQIQKRSEGGIGRKADLDQAEGRVALARTNLMAEEANLRDAETEFLRKVGIPVPNHLATPGHPEHFPANEFEAVEMGLKHHPILRASVEDVNVVRAEHKGARAPFVPRFDLQLGMTRNHNLDGTQGDNDDNSAMLRMRWNLFSGGKDLANLCRTAYKMQEAQEVQNRAHRQVVESVRLAWSTYETAKKQLRWFKDHVDASTRTSEAYAKQFNIGQRTLLDLLDSENELFGARTAYTNGKYTEMLGRFRILNAAGCLTEGLRMELPKQAEPRPTALMDGTSRFFDNSTTLFD
ncbi:MAG: TolC family outer membrane protein [Gammaproteobacteria bacterium]|jgi:adhesin transport system outer membrane protein|nr:TolC family outer membrane protein [Gammaproteobacteria bacterium]